MSGRYTLYGWQVSYYTGKVRSYLRYKGIPFDERSPNIFNYYVSLRRRTGTVAIPVVHTPEGEWLQDSSDIIDRLEARFPAPSVLPATPVQRIAAYLFELWGDEFWLPTGLATRWCHMEDNYAFLTQDVANDLLPDWPRAIQRRAADQVARHMYRYLPKAGVVIRLGYVRRRLRSSLRDRRISGPAGTDGGSGRAERPSGANSPTMVLPLLTKSKLVTKVASRGTLVTCRGLFVARSVIQTWVASSPSVM